MSVRKASSVRTARNCSAHAARLTVGQGRDVWRRLHDPTRPTRLGMPVSFSLSLRWPSGGVCYRLMLPMTGQWETCAHTTRNHPPEIRKQSHPPCPIRRDLTKTGGRAWRARRACAGSAVPWHLRWSWRARWPSHGDTCSPQWHGIRSFAGGERHVMGSQQRGDGSSDRCG